MQTIPANWITDDSGCTAVTPSGGEGGGPGDGGDGVGGGSEGSGDPGGGSCGEDDAGSGGLDGGSCGGDEGSGSNCFLTTAVVERRGEPDDGPTLSVLRRFRDGYMMETIERQALVAAYYETAPSIVAAIPADHPDWEWIGGRIDAAIAAIRNGDDRAAFDVYADMMRRLTSRWLGPEAEDGR